MTKTSFPFHIQQNTDLNIVSQTVGLGQFGEISPSDLAERTGKTETDILKRIRAPLSQMGVINRWELAPFGKRLAILRDERPELLGEAMHMQLYTLHWYNRHAYFSFAYATMCDWLCERGQYQLDGNGQSALVGVVLQHAMEEYKLDPAGIAFSKSSVQGAMHWLEATEPPALQTGNFQRRHAAPLHALLWAVEALYARQLIARGTRLTLDDDVQTCLARALLLDPEALRRLLDVTQMAYDYRRKGGFFGVGTEGGFGRWLLLSRALPNGALEPVHYDEGLPEGPHDGKEIDNIDTFAVNTSDTEI